MVEDNGRITLAILGQKLDNLHALVEKYVEKIDAGQKERHDLDTRLARIEERLTMYAVGLSIFSLVASVIAAYIATIVK